MSESQERHQAMTDCLIDIGSGDYAACKDALEGKPSAAAVRWGSRDAWAAVVALWDDCVRDHGKVCHITVWTDGTTTGWPGNLTDYAAQ